MNAADETRASNPGARDGVGPASTGGAPPTPAIAPRAYEPPRLEPLGEWSALTLQQSVCVGDGCF